MHYEPKDRKRIRKVERKSKHLTRALVLKMIDDYRGGTYTIKDLSYRYSITEVLVRKHIDEFLSELLNVDNTRTLLNSQKVPTPQGKKAAEKSLDFRKAFETQEHNQEFLNLLSEDDSPTLSEEEASFCWHWVYGSSSIEAVEKSGMDAGLIKPNKKDPTRVTNYRNICKLRSLYLRRKANILAFIQSIQADTLQRMNIDKNFVVQEILRQIEELRDSKDIQARRLLAKFIDNLSNILGLYSQTVNVNQVDMGDTIDILMSKAKEAQVTSDQPQIEQKKVTH